MVRFFIALLCECKAPRFVGAILAKRVRERRVILKGNSGQFHSPRFERGRGERGVELVQKKRPEEGRDSSLELPGIRVVSPPEWGPPFSKSRDVFQKNRFWR